MECELFQKEKDVKDFYDTAAREFMKQQEMRYNFFYDKHAKILDS